MSNQKSGAHHSKGGKRLAKGGPPSGSATVNQRNYHGRREVTAAWAETAPAANTAVLDTPRPVKPQPKTAAPAPSAPPRGTSQTPPAARQSRPEKHAQAPTAKAAPQAPAAQAAPQPPQAPADSAPKRSGFAPKPRAAAMGESLYSAMTAGAALAKRAAAHVRSAAKGRTRVGGARAKAGDPPKSNVQSIRRISTRFRHIVREKKAHRFPESERAPVQLLLFAWGMIPLLAGKLREATWGWRKRAISFFGRSRTAVERQLRKWKLHPAVVLGVGGVAAVVLIFFSNYTLGVTVSYDGEPIASVESDAAAQDAFQDLESVTTQVLGESYSIDASLLSYSSGLLRRQELVDSQTLEETLSDQIGLIIPAYGLYVEGEFIGATPYAGAIKQLLDQLKGGITDEDTISCSFAEEVEVREEFVTADQILNLGYMAETLYSTKTAEITYSVKKGDTWSEIANDHGLTTAELLELNPGYNINKLQIGEVLTLSASVPYLTMTVMERERYVSDVPYEIEYTDSADLYQGDYKVTSAGAYGAADTVANVTYVNGEETARTILSSVTLKSPVTEQRLRGTKERPTWLPTGSFRWPTTGRISSRFGYRNLSYSYASTNHKGIDIAGSYGTPIYAADGGTVSYAGWMSGYGYLVQINHNNNGYVTYYGHNSSLTVTVGQHVYKGQQIARMGSTGNSTGNHCHFEVRYNGVPKNPLNYLP